MELSPVCYQEELLAACAERNVAVVAYSPFGGCWLAKYFSAFVPWSHAFVFDDPAVQAVAREAGCTPAQATLAWVRSKGCAVIPKSLRPERIRESVVDVELTADQVSRLDALNDPRRGVGASLEAHARIIASDGYSWDPT